MAGSDDKQRAVLGCLRAHPKVAACAALRRTGKDDEYDSDDSPSKTDIEQGKLAHRIAAKLETERAYVARYGQKADAVLGTKKEGSIAGTPKTVVIKAIRDPEDLHKQGTTPGGGVDRTWSGSLKRMLSSLGSWDALQHPVHLMHADSADSSASVSARSNLSKQSTLSKVGSQDVASPVAHPGTSRLSPLKVPGKRDLDHQTTRHIDASEMAAIVSSPNSFMRAATSQPVAYHEHDRAHHDLHHEDAQRAQQPSVAHKGPGLIGQLFRRKLEQQMPHPEAPHEAEPDSQPATPRIYVRRDSKDDEQEDGVADRRQSSSSEESEGDKRASDDGSFITATSGSIASSESGHTSLRSASSGNLPSQGPGRQADPALGPQSSTKGGSQGPGRDPQAGARQDATQQSMPQRSRNVSRAGSLASSQDTTWHEVELASDPEDDKASVATHGSRRTSVLSRASSADPAEGSLPDPAAVAAFAAMGTAAAAELQVLRCLPFSDLPHQAAQVAMIVVITLEEVLPRPKSGLLSRMLRLAEVSLAGNGSLEDPVFLLHPGGEYHLGISVLHPAAGRVLPIKCASWVRIQPVDGEPLTLDVDPRGQESPDRLSASGEAEAAASHPSKDRRGTAAWDTTLHDSPILSSVAAAGDGKQATVLPVEITIGFKCKRHGKGGHHAEMVVSKALNVKVVARGTERAPGSEFKPNEAMEQLLTAWGHDDLNAHVVMCIKSR
ncbi:hypothetical protein WJX72_007489 [[Myrmecia] bisecta]|uniref:Uncharacterized protein n=1 Tax=[Myrmecia] bisecta TaxID=41462 RepID=A0AAW1PPC2_9CHLO